jgi:hypothetical protein
MDKDISSLRSSSKKRKKNTTEYMAETPLNPVKVLGNQLLCWWLLAHILFYEIKICNSTIKI